MENNDEPLSTIEQIIKLMDGRTRRMFAMEVKIPEQEFSKKMNGRIFFSQKEINRINIRWNSNITLIKPAPAVEIEFKEIEKQALAKTG